MKKAVNNTAFFSIYTYIQYKMNDIIIPEVTFAYNFAYDLIFKELFEARKKANEETLLA